MSTSVYNSLSQPFLLSPSLLVSDSLSLFIHNYLSLCFSLFIKPSSLFSLLHSHFFVSLFLSLFLSLSLSFSLSITICYSPSISLSLSLSLFVTSSFSLTSCITLNFSASNPLSVHNNLSLYCFSIHSYSQLSLPLSLFTYNSPSHSLSLSLFITLFLTLPFFIRNFSPFFLFICKSLSPLSILLLIILARSYLSQSILYLCLKTWHFAFFHCRRDEHVPASLACLVRVAHHPIPEMTHAKRYWLALSCRHSHCDRLALLKPRLPRLKTPTCLVYKIGKSCAYRLASFADH
ncbi:unnamed protein product [Acanthosepion pharaonis]|uniref:Uncharacterized protein n=1 Tax=Acanthosepion pharaonis TaxID=158019 RepID=A0A812EHC4_ACAPH|nr:unnamed protein product [Sepia pharaonis]